MLILGVLFTIAGDEAGGDEPDPPPEEAFTLEHLEPSLKWHVAAHINAVHEYEQATWYAGVQRAADARQAAREAADRRAAATRRTPSPTTAQQGSGACGGSLPSCAVLACESGGNIRAQNPRSSASGKWQVISSTWNGYGGYPTAASAPESVQDAHARQLYAGGAGRGHWVC